MNEEKRIQSKTYNEKSFRSSKQLITFVAKVFFIILLALGITFFLSAHVKTQEKPKYVFVFMGDGMGINQVASARYWEAKKKGQSASDSIWNASSFDSFPVIGAMSTHNMDLTVTDSAASATALFSGKKTRNGSLNYNPETKELYEPFAKKLSQNGYAVGVISTTSLEHASPSALYANSEYRYDFLNIARQGISCGWLDFWAAGGFNQEEESLLEEAEKNGFTVVDSPDKLEKVNGQSLPVLAISRDEYAAPYMAYEIDRARREQYGANEISFADLVKQAASSLHEIGKFFIFAEAGKIDIACTDGDVVSSIYEVKGLDDAVAEALAFYEKYPENTLIVVLADHETGSLRIGSEINSDAISSQVASRVRFERIMSELYESDASFSEAMEKSRHYLGISEASLQPVEHEELEMAFERTKIDRDWDEFTARLYLMKAARSNLEFVSGDHSGQPVLVYALGCGSENFAGMYDNTDIYKKLNSIMELQ